MAKKSKEVKNVISQLADPDSYLPTVEQCLTDKEKKKMPAQHIANVMALTADLIFTNSEAIIEAFEKNNGLEVTFKAKLAVEKDTVGIQFKPVSEYKDSASAAVDDPDQEKMDFGDKKGSSNSQEETKEASNVMTLPAPDDDGVIDAEEVKTLPAPEDQDGEEGE